MWVSGLVLTIYFLCHDSFQNASAVPIVPISVLLLYFAWGALIALRKPDILIKDDKIYLFGRLSPEPILLSLGEFLSIERQSKTPIWRLPPQKAPWGQNL
jgi:hypothetical protein